MIEWGAGNRYFEEDYYPNMERFKAEAAEKFGVVYERLF